MEAIINEGEYKDGFNRGYWLFNYEPEVAKILIETIKNKTDDFNIGFSEGYNQAELDKTLNQFAQLRENSNEKENDIER